MRCEHPASIRKETMREEHQNDGSWFRDEYCFTQGDTAIMVEWHPITELDIAEKPIHVHVREIPSGDLNAVRSYKGRETLMDKLVSKLPLILVFLIGAPLLIVFALVVNHPLSAPLTSLVSVLIVIPTLFLIISILSHYKAYERGREALWSSEQRSVNVSTFSYMDARSHFENPNDTPHVVALNFDDIVEYLEYEDVEKLLIIQKQRDEVMERLEEIRSKKWEADSSWNTPKEEGTVSEECNILNSQVETCMSNLRCLNEERENLVNTLNKKIQERSPGPLRMRRRVSSHR